MYYVELALAIVMELLGTNLMKLSNGFSRLWFALGTFVAYGCCFFFLSLSRRGCNQVPSATRNLTTLSSARTLTWRSRTAKCTSTEC